jgi:hypothetical protein
MGVAMFGGMRVDRHAAHRVLDAACFRSRVMMMEGVSFLADHGVLHFR